MAEKGLFYPPDPASKGSCFIGGNLAENSGGPKAVKYGVTKDYVVVSESDKDQLKLKYFRMQRRNLIFWKWLRK